MFWTDKEIDALDLSTRKWYEKYPQKPIIKVDMAKFEIPYLYGGVYADHDTLFLKSFNPLTRHTFFTTMGIPGAELETMYFIYGCEKGSRIMRALIKNIDDSAFDPAGDYVSYFRTFSSYYFNRILFECLPFEPEAVFYPEEYFAPFPGSCRAEVETGGIDVVLPHIKPETYSVHLWSVSWKDQFK
jgi:hypothetical protein